LAAARVRFLLREFVREVDHVSYREWWWRSDRPVKPLIETKAAFGKPATRGNDKDGSTAAIRPDAHPD
jgi:hypothetical protein